MPVGLRTEKPIIDRLRVRGAEQQIKMVASPRSQDSPVSSTSWRGFAFNAYT